VDSNRHLDTFRTVAVAFLRIDYKLKITIF